MLHDVEWYHQQYAARYVDVTLENGLPAPMLVMSKHAVSNWTRVGDDLAASFPEYSAAYDVHRAEGEGCTYASLPMYVSDSEHYQIDVRFVHNPTARTPAGGASWREYEEDVRSTHQELLHLLQWDATSTRTCRSGPTPRSTRTRAAWTTSACGGVHSTARARRSRARHTASFSRRASPACTACGYTGQSPTAPSSPRASCCHSTRARRHIRAPRQSSNPAYIHTSAWSSAHFYIHTDDPIYIHTDGPAVYPAAQRSPPAPPFAARRVHEPPVSARETRFRAPPAREVRGPAAGNGGGAPIADFDPGGSAPGGVVFTGGSGAGAGLRRGGRRRAPGGGPPTDESFDGGARLIAGGPPVTLSCVAAAVLRSLTERGADGFRGPLFLEC